MPSLVDPFRLACLLLAAGAFGWAVAVGPGAASGWTSSVVGERMRLGQTFTAASIAPLGAAPTPAILGSTCLSDVLRGRVMVLSRLTAAAEANLDLPLFDARIEMLEAATRELLGCQPYDSFGWLMLYWADGHRHGFRPETNRFLAMSYRTGPREAWIAAQRNRFAAIAYDRLPPRLQEEARTEWGLLVQDQLFDAATTSLLALADQAQAAFLDRRHAVRRSSYLMFGHFLDARGIDIVLPDGPVLRPKPFIVAPAS